MTSSADLTVPRHAVPLTRAALSDRTGTTVPPPPVRIVHIGLGAFARSHQAWYTSVVDAAGQWGIAAFTGRSAGVADLLAPQDGLYSLVTRGASADEICIVSSIVAVHPAADVARLVKLLAAPTTAIVTLTITESGYHLGADGRADRADPAVADDIEVLRSGASPQSLTTVLGRLVLGLAERRRRGAGALAIVPCDNIPGNGAIVRAGALSIADAVDPALAAWIGRTISFVSTSVDRITPRATPADVAVVAAATGWRDAAPVITEPFHDWVLSGAFPGGRPAWEHAGARFVDDIAPFERRKLWLLNGAHSLLAYAGLLRGRDTVAEAISDPVCLAAVEDFWDEAALHLPAGLDVSAYRCALRERFSNGRIAHHLRQIAADGLLKVGVRHVPVALAERSAGRPAAGAAAAVAAWIAYVQNAPLLDDAGASAIREAASGDDPARGLLCLLSPELAADESFAENVVAAAAAWRTEGVPA